VSVPTCGSSSNPEFDGRRPVASTGFAPCTQGPAVLNLVLPKGSLEKATMELFEAADLPVERSSSVAYKA